MKRLHTAPRPSPRLRLPRTWGVRRPTPRLYRAGDVIAFVARREDGILTGEVISRRDYADGSQPLYAVLCDDTREVVYLMPRDILV